MASAMTEERSSTVDIELPVRVDASVDLDPEGASDVETPMLAVSALSTRAEDPLSPASVSACDRRSSIAMLRRAKMYRIWGKRVGMGFMLVTAVVFAALYFSTQKSREPMATAMLASKSRMDSMDQDPRAAGSSPMGPTAFIPSNQDDVNHGEVLQEGRNALNTTWDEKKPSKSDNDKPEVPATESSIKAPAWEDDGLVTEPHVTNLIITTERTTPSTASTFSAVQSSLPSSIAYTSRTTTAAPSTVTTAAPSTVTTAAPSTTTTTTTTTATTTITVRSTTSAPQMPSRIERRTPYGIRVGEFSQCSNMISGEVFVVDRNRLYVANFTHDGTEADFWGGTDASDLNKGFFIPYPAMVRYPTASRRYPQKIPRLGVNILLELPPNSSVSLLTYLSLRKREGTDLGTVPFPVASTAGEDNTLEIPESGVISVGFVTISHGVTSGPVTLVDDTTVDIDKLSYDGRGEDAYFFGTLRNTTAAGTITSTSRPINVKMTRVMFVDEKGKGQPIRRYVSESIRLQIPENIQQFTWKDFETISISTADGKDFGIFHIVLPDSPPLPPSISLLKAQAEQPPLRGVKGSQPTILSCSATFNNNSLNVKITSAADFALKKALAEIDVALPDSSRPTIDFTPGRRIDGEGLYVGLLWGITEQPSRESSREILVDPTRGRLTLIGMARNGTPIARTYVPLVDLKSFLQSQQAQARGTLKSGSQIPAFPKSDVRIIRADKSPTQMSLLAMQNPDWTSSATGDELGEDEQQRNMAKDLLPDRIWIGEALPSLSGNGVTFDQILNTVDDGMYSACKRGL